MCCGYLYYREPKNVSVLESYSNEGNYFEHKLSLDHIGDGTVRGDSFLACIQIGKGHVSPLVQPIDYSFLSFIFQHSWFRDHTAGLLVGAGIAGQKPVYHPTSLDFCYECIRNSGSVGIVGGSFSDRGFVFPGVNANLSVGNDRTAGPAGC